VDAAGSTSRGQWIASLTGLISPDPSNFKIDAKLPYYEPPLLCKTHKTIINQWQSMKADESSDAVSLAANKRNME
jgi:hypothetical protein